jgi:hypothetical protein
LRIVARRTTNDRLMFTGIVQMVTGSGDGAWR